MTLAEPIEITVTTYDHDPTLYMATWDRGAGPMLHFIPEMFLDLIGFMTARALLIGGCDPDQELVVRLRGSDCEMLRAPLGVCAATPLPNFAAPVRQAPRLQVRTIKPAQPIEEELPEITEALPELPTADTHAGFVVMSKERPRKIFALAVGHIGDDGKHCLDLVWGPTDPETCAKILSAKYGIGRAKTVTGPERTALTDAVTGLFAVLGGKGAPP